MNYNKMSLFIFMIIVLTVPAILAQQKYLDKMLKQYLEKSLYSLEGEIDTTWLKDEILGINIHEDLQKIVIDQSSNVDSVIATKVNGSKEKYIYNFDNNNNMIMLLSQNWDGNQWVNDKRKTYTFDLYSTLILSSNWDGNQWLDEWRKTYEYDVKDNITFFLFERWEENYWNRRMQWFYIYDSDTNLISLLAQERYDGPWYFTSHVSYSYNADGISTGYLSQVWSSDRWKANSRKTLTYDTSGNIIVELVEDFIYGESFRRIYTYDNYRNRITTLNEPLNGNPIKWRRSFEYDYAGNMTIELTEQQLNEGEPWENDYAKRYDYDDEGNMTSKLREGWHRDHWGSSGRWSYNYDSKGNLDIGLFEIWDNGQWNNPKFNNTLEFYDSYGRKYSYSAVKINAFFSLVTDIKDEELNIPNFSLSQNYPNPFNPTTTITYSIPKSGFVQLKLYDILGAEIKTIVNKDQEIGSYKIELNASYLSSGTYFYNLQSGEFSETKKLVILK